MVKFSIYLNRRVFVVRVMFRASKTSNFPTDHSKAVFLLQFFFINASVVPYMAFVLSRFVSHLSFIVLRHESRNKGMKHS